MLANCDVQLSTNLNLTEWAISVKRNFDHPFFEEEGKNYARCDFFLQTNSDLLSFLFFLTFTFFDTFNFFRKKILDTLKRQSEQSVFAPIRASWFGHQIILAEVLMCFLLIERESNTTKDGNKNS